MSGYLNKVCIIGNLGADPDIRDVSGQSIANFSVATTESWKDKNSGEKRERTEWHRVVVWNEALVVNVIEKYVKKGSRIYLEGQLQTRKWWRRGDEETADNARYSTEIVLTGFDGKLVLLGDAGGGGNRDPNDNASRPGNGGGRGDDGGAARTERNSYADARGRSQPRDGGGDFGGGRMLANGRSAPAADLDDEIPF